MKRGRKFLLPVTLILVGVLVLSSLSAWGSQNAKPGMSLLEARKDLEQDLLRLAGAGLAGIAHSGAEREVIVFVEDEQARQEVPASFAGYTVRTEVTGRMGALSTPVAEPVAEVSEDGQGEVRPLVGGTSLSAYVREGGLIHVYAGTMGMVTYDGKILSNAHVIAMVPATDTFLDTGTPIVQPGTRDGGRLAQRVGELEDYIPIDFGNGARNYADAAIGSIDGDITISAGEQLGDGGNYWIQGWTEVSKGDIVRKSGRTTGVTTGEVIHANASVLVWYGNESAYFVDQIVVTQENWSFTEAGDSGSAVDKDGEFVGLVFAGSETHAVISKAEHIIDGLGISVEPVEEVCYLTISSTTGGSVPDPGEGVFPCDVGAVVTLVARPDEGYRFVRWTGDVGSIADVEAAQTTITMEGNYSITADFELMPAMYSLAVSSTVGGSATEPGEGTFVYPVGTVVTLVAEPEAGYRFVNWTGDVGTIADVEAAGTTIAMHGSYSVTANFELIQGLYSLTISSGAGGSVTEPGEGIFIWTAGTVVTLVAQPEEGSRFRKWIGDVGTVADINAAQTTITMYDSYSITASFDTWHLEPVALLTISSTEGGSVTTPGEGTFPYALGSTVALAVEAESGYRFASWSGDVGTIADVDTPSTTIVTDSSYSIVAGFERVPSRCCTATAAYGTPVAQELGILRQFRDEYLLTNPVGQTLAALYYKISPPVAEFITTHPDVKPVVRAGLLPAVAMSTLVLNTTLADNVALGGLWALALAALIAWAIGRRGWRTGRI